MTFSAMRGAATLIMAISSCAVLLPTLSIMSAAFRQSRRRHLDVDARFGNPLFPDRVFGDRACRRPSRLNRRWLIFSSATSAAPMRAHAMMDAARARGGPCAISKPRPSPSSRLLDRHAHVLEQHFRVAVRARRHSRKPAACAAPRRRGRRAAPESATAARGVRLVRVGLAHDDGDLAARIADARGPPLAAVDHIVVAVAPDARSRYWWRRTRRPPARSSGRPSGFRRSSAGAATSPSARRAVAMQDFHVAGVGRRAVEHFRGEADAAHRSATGAYSRLVRPAP